MTKMELDERVVALVEEAHLYVMPRSDESELGVGDDEVHVVVRLTDCRYSVERIDRGVSYGIVLVTEEREALHRFLVELAGPGWRMYRHLRRIYATAPTLGIPAGYEVTEESDGRFTVRWSRDGRQCRASGLGENDAQNLARMLAFTLDEVIASYKDPEGRPVYPQKGEPPTRFWRR